MRLIPAGGTEEARSMPPSLTPRAKGCHDPGARQGSEVAVWQRA